MVLGCAECKIPRFVLSVPWLPQVFCYELWSRIKLGSKLLLKMLSVYVVRKSGPKLVEIIFWIGFSEKYLCNAFLIAVKTSQSFFFCICSVASVIMTFSYINPTSLFRQGWCKTAHMQCIHVWVRNWVSAGVDGHENASVWEKNCWNGKLWQDLYVFPPSAAVRPVSTSNQCESKRSNFSVHTTMQVRMKQQRRLAETASAVNSWGSARWLPPWESVIIFGWAASTVTSDQIVAGFSPLRPADPPPPSETNKSQLKVKSGHLGL